MGTETTQVEVLAAIQALSGFSLAAEQMLAGNELFTHKAGFLLNSGSKNMTVNGSMTPLNFDFTPAAGERWKILRLTLLIQDPGTFDATDFGSISGSLTNGVLITTKSNGSAYDIATLYDNVDIATIFGDQASNGSASGQFLQDGDWGAMSLTFRSPLVLIGDSGDYVRARIRDNLSALSVFRMAYQAIKE